MTSTPSAAETGPFLPQHQGFSSGRGEGAFPPGASGSWEWGRGGDKYYELSLYLHCFYYCIGIYTIYISNNLRCAASFLFR